MNLTDGLDGLAIGCTLIASAALTALTYITGNARFSDYLDISVTSGRLANSRSSAARWSAPVSAFSGTTRIRPRCSWAMSVRSLSGGAIGTIAVIIKQELLLIFIGGVFVAEALSVMIQVASFKMRGKRVFKMAPLHHHFELLGWSESKVIIGFGSLSLILALFSSVDTETEVAAWLKN